MTTESAEAETRRRSTALSARTRATDGDGTNRGDGGVASAGGVAITRTPLRPGGWIGYADGAVYVDRDDQRTRIGTDAITGVALRTAEWDLAVMSLLLVGVGGYVGVTRNPLVGVGFALVGALSLYRSYRRRHRLAIHVENRPKPTVVYPEYPAECHEALAEHAGLRLGAESETTR